MLNFNDGNSEQEVKSITYKQTLKQMSCANIRVVLRKNFCGIRTLKIQAVLMNMIETPTIDQTITFYQLPDMVCIDNN